MTEDVTLGAIATLQRTLKWFGPNGERWLKNDEDKNRDGRKASIVAALHASWQGDLTHEHFQKTNRARTALRKAVMEMGYDSLIAFNVAVEFSAVVKAYESAIELLEWGMVDAD